MLSIKPTDSELEILQVLWQEGPCTVRRVNDRLNERREVGYTTTLKLLQIMFEKELVTREDAGRTHIYTAAVAAETARSALLDDFVEQAFAGNAAQLVLQALGNHNPSAAELDEIKALIAQLEQKQAMKP